MEHTPVIQTLRLFGVTEDTLRLELADVLQSTAPTAALTVCEGDAVLTLTADSDQKDALEDMVRTVQERLGDAVYSVGEDSLEKQVVALLTRHGKTVAAAESCTGGMIAARITGVPGSSAVFGTGVVSYSWDCKEKLLKVEEAVLRQEGAVSAHVAGQMARGVQQLSGADIGVSITGEAGPVAAENQPVGTVFIALADKKRTWVQEWHIDGKDRNAIRREACGYVLNLLRRYLEAYPTVMAGGVPNHRAAAQRVIPTAQAAQQPRFLSRLLPWKGDSPPKIAAKLAVWLLLLALLIGSIVGVYHNLLAPASNRELQNSLLAMYQGGTEDLTNGADSSGVYPPGMSPQFRSLYNMNSDVGGWIRIPHSTVDYPVMQYRNGFYERHNFKKHYSVYGQPYFSANNPITGADKNKVLTVYGRNTEDGQMFSQLLDYRRLAFLQEHPIIELNTLYETGRWEIFAVAVTHEQEESVWNSSPSHFASQEEYTRYMQEWSRRTLFRSNKEVTLSDRLLILSVNAEEAYDHAGIRLVIAARLLAGEEEKAVFTVNGAPLMPQVLRPTGPRPNRHPPQTDRPAPTAATTIRATEVPTTTRKPEGTSGTSEPTQASSKNSTTVTTTVTAAATTTATTATVVPTGDSSATKATAPTTQDPQNTTAAENGRNPGSTDAKQPDTE